MSRQLWSLFSIAALTLAGCGGGSGPSVPTAAVSGKVTLKNEPLAGATINFVGPEFAGAAVTRSDGTYTLVQGAQVGENRVYISMIDKSKLEGIEFSDNPEDGMDAGQLAAMNVDPAPRTGKGAASDLPLGEMIPADYSDPDKTILKFPVPAEGTDKADFAL